MYVCVRIYIYIYVCVCTYMNTCCSACIHTRIHTYIHAYIHTCIYIYIYIHTYIHTYIHVNIYIYIYTYNIHVYIYIYNIRMVLHKIRNLCAWRYEDSDTSYTHFLCNTMHSGYLSVHLRIYTYIHEHQPSHKEHGLYCTHVVLETIIMIININYNDYQYQL